MQGRVTTPVHGIIPEHMLPPLSGSLFFSKFPRCYSPSVPACRETERGQRLDSLLRDLYHWPAPGHTSPQETLGNVDIIDA